MNLLFITTQFPYPLDNGGKIGAYNGISVVSKDFDVTVLSFTEQDEYIEEGIEYYSKKFNNVKFEKPIHHDVHIRKKKFKLIKAMLSGYVKKMPYIVSKFVDKNMYKKIDEMFQGNRKWDIVFIDYLNMYSYGEYIKKKYGNLIGKFILKDHNLEYELVKQEALSSKGLKKIVLNVEWKRTFKYEKNAVKNSEFVFSVCDSNTNELKRFNSNTWTMYPTYEMLPKRGKITNNNSILYIGNLSWKSNMDGLKWFVEKTFGLIKKAIPDASLTIVGSGCNDNYFKDYDDVNYLGYVKDISNIYDDYKVFIVPLFEGSGIRIKILEAFNNEIAVVSTTLGCETIGVQSGKELFIADNEIEFSKAIVELLKNEELNNRIRNEGKELLKKKFSLTARQEEFKSILFDCKKEK